MIPPILYLQRLTAYWLPFVHRAPSRDRQRASPQHHLGHAIELGESGGSEDQREDQGGLARAVAKGKVLGQPKQAGGRGACAGFAGSWHRGLYDCEKVRGGVGTVQRIKSVMVVTSDLTCTLSEAKASMHHSTISRL
jgi:hypothetical protein